jgi:hypothetical protein
VSADRAETGDVLAAVDLAAARADDAARPEQVERLGRAPLELARGSPAGMTPRLTLATCASVKGGPASSSRAWKAQKRWTM